VNYRPKTKQHQLEA